MRKTKNKKGIKHNKKTRKYKGIGGAQEFCLVCKQYYTKYDKSIKPGLCNCPNFQNNAYYEDHVRTHPFCDYCKTSHMNVSALADHIKQNHNEEYNIAKNIKTGFTTNNLIDELKANNTPFIGVLPDLNLFYKKINDAKQDAAKKAAEKAKKAEQEAAREAAEKAKKAKKEASEANKKMAKEAAKAKKEAAEEAERIQKEEQRIKREQAEAKKALVEKEKAIALAKEKEEKELALAKANKEKALALAKQNEEKANMGIEDALAKGFAKTLAIENDNMGIEDALAKAITVEDVIKIIESAEESHEEPQVPMQSPITLPPMVTTIDTSFAITKLFTPMIHFKPINIYEKYKKNYKIINHCVVFYIGIINYFLKKQGKNLKFILKGGKAAQILQPNVLLLPEPAPAPVAPVASLEPAPAASLMPPPAPLSKREQENKMYEENKKKEQERCIQNFCSNDIDILLVQDGMYDSGFLLSVAKQFAENIKTAFSTISILDPSSPELTNKNIVKVSYIYPGTLTKNKEEYVNEYLPICDIDISENKSEYFNDIIETYKTWNKNGFMYHLLYYHQSRESFIAEKRHYYDVYKEISHKMPDSEKVCDCSKHHVDAECKPTCSYRSVMLQKFKRYLDFF